MSDRRLRDLERRAVQGEHEAEAGLLLERVRLGLLPAERLELAAYLGHPPACRALDDPGAGLDLEAWIRGLRPWGKPVWVRAAVASARLVLPLWEREHGKGDLRPRRAVEAAEAWLLIPTTERTEAARTAAEAAQNVLGELNVKIALLGTYVERQTTLAEAFRETRAAVQAAVCAAEDDRRGIAHAVLAGVAARERLALQEAPIGPGGSALHVRAAQADRLGHLPGLNTPRAAARVREAIRLALVPWAVAAA